MKIAILSRNSHLYSTRRLVEAAEAAGHEAHVIDHLKCNIEIEQTGPALYYHNQYLKYEHFGVSNEKLRNRNRSSKL